MLEMDKIKSNVRTCKEILLEFKNLKNRDNSSKLLFTIHHLRVFNQVMVQQWRLLQQFKYL